MLVLVSLDRRGCREHFGTKFGGLCGSLEFLELFWKNPKNLLVFFGGAHGVGDRHTVDIIDIMALHMWYP
jgi:hypothetical protein